MSKLQELIRELCPDGVEYKRIQEVAEVGTGSCNGNEAEEGGAYPFFVRSQNIKSKNDFQYDEEAIIIPGEGGIGDIFHYVNGKYALHQRVYRIHFINESINVKFIYYYMRSNFKSFILKKAVSATVTSIRKPMIEQFEIPVPPLSVQEEIVRILDHFTNLAAELQAELQARKEQYEYYRNKLLAFDKTGKGTQNVTWMKMSEIASFTYGYTDKALKDGDTRFIRVNANAAKYYEVMDQWVLSVSATAGYIYGLNQDVRINNRYYLGGSSLRGFDVAGVGARDKATGDALGGDWRLTASTQLMFPLGLPSEFGIKGKVFVDAGMLGRPDGHYVSGTIDYNNTPRVSVGTGILWQSPMGPINIDLGFPIVKEDYDETEVFRLNFGTGF